MALNNKRPGGVEVDIMAGRGVGMEDQFEDKFEPGQTPSKEDLETFRIVFELFDRDKSGYINV